MKKLPVLLTIVLLFSLCFFAYQEGLLPDKVTENSADTEYFSTSKNGTQAKEFYFLSEKRAVDRIGSLCHDDMLRSDILASVSAAQFILESIYGTSDLAQEANNCFGMKCYLSGNTWDGSTWDGVSKYTKKKKDEDMMTAVDVDFRKYACVEDSVADHSAYLLGAMDGDMKRYEGLAGETDYRKAIRIIIDGGYTPDSGYADMICEIIEEYDLTRFDQTVSEAEAA